MKKVNLIIYTALIGSYDKLIDFNKNFIPPETLLLCFTDNKSLISKTWTIKHIKCGNNDFAYLNRKIKILFNEFLPNHNYNLYIDSNVRIKKPINGLISSLILSNVELILPKHYSRDCIYKEAEPILILGKEKENIVRNQIKRYKLMGFPENFGLGENNILFRKNGSNEIFRLMNCWWKEYCNGAKRDQLSLMYCIWINNFSSFNLGLISSRRNKFFGLELHNNELKTLYIISGYSSLKKWHDNNQPLPNLFSLFLSYYKNFLDKISRL